MFWSKRSGTTTLAAGAIAKEPIPVAASPEIMGEELAEYEAIAKKIGFDNPALIEARLRIFFAENGICVYPYEKVFSYLDSKYGKPYGWSRNWGWRPLRKQDVKRVFIGEVSGHYEGLYQKNGHVLNQNENYVAAVPTPVLRTVEKIAEAFPDVHFFVSDQLGRGDRTRDPFLAVMVQNMQPLVVERWDEPAFRM